MDTRARDSAAPEIRLKRRPPRLFLVTDDDVVGDRGFLARAAAVLEAGGSGCALQLRAHGLRSGAVWELARRLRQVTAETRWSLWINDRVDVALVVRADGVQLGARSVPPTVARRLLGRTCWIGRSVHGADEALSANADLAVLGSIYATESHPGRRPLGLETLTKAASGARPIVAIGGITPQRVAEVMECGAQGIAVLSGIWRARDAAEALREYLSALNAAAASTAVGGRADMNYFI
ncbi:MAG: thiamine phosphate synthase [Gemmatimonadota bacterium]